MASQLSLVLSAGVFLPSGGSIQVLQVGSCRDGGAGCVTFLWFAGRSVSFVLRREAGRRAVEKYMTYACIFLLPCSTAALHLPCDGVW